MDRRRKRKARRRTVILVLTLEEDTWRNGGGSLCSLNSFRRQRRRYRRGEDKNYRFRWKRRSSLSFANNNLGQWSLVPFSPTRDKINTPGSWKPVQRGPLWGQFEKGREFRKDVSSQWGAEKPLLLYYERFGSNPPSLRGKYLSRVKFKKKDFFSFERCKGI